jgi:hypothetical protein
MPAPNVLAKPLRTLTTRHCLAALSVVLLCPLWGCGLMEPGHELGQFARLEVACQLGQQADAFGKQEPLFRCEFRNVAKAAGRSCIKLKVTHPKAPKGMAIVSEKLCSGTLLPDTDADGVTDALDRCPRHGAAHEGGGAYSIDDAGCREPVIHPQTAPALCGSSRTGRCVAEVFTGNISNSIRRALQPFVPKDERCYSSRGVFICGRARDLIAAACFDDKGAFTCDLDIEEVPQ